MPSLSLGLKKYGEAGESGSEEVAKRLFRGLHLQADHIAVCLTRKYGVKERELQPAGDGDIHTHNDVVRSVRSHLSPSNITINPGDGRL